MCRRRSEDDLVWPRSHGGRDDFPCLVKRLCGKPTRAVETDWIAPSGLLCFKPRLARKLKHRLA
jgi:hypothetical protein